MDNKCNELSRQIKKNGIIQTLLNKANEDLRKTEESKTNTNETSLACDICDFVGKSKSGLLKHAKNKHGKKKVQEFSAKKESESDEFANRVNDFLKSVNHLNNAENNYSCDKWDSNLASKECLDIHIGAKYIISLSRAQVSPEYFRSL